MKEEIEVDFGELWNKFLNNWKGLAGCFILAVVLFFIALPTKFEVTDTVYVDKIVYEEKIVEVEVPVFIDKEITMEELDEIEEAMEKKSFGIELDDEELEALEDGLEEVANEIVSELNDLFGWGKE